MIKIIEQEISFDDALKKKLEFICDFCNTTPKFINGSIRKIDKTNLSYIEPHRIIINDITFLAFNYSTEIFIENLCNKIKLSDLEDNKKSISKEITNLNKDKEDVYAEVISDMYDNKIISEKTFDRIIGWDNEKDKQKDDFEL